MMSAVSTSAVNSVEIFENGSELSDEQLSDRIQLVPVRGEPGDVFSLIVEGPAVVTSDSLKGATVSGIIICKLGPERRLNIRPTVETGTGAQHAKWSPISAFCYPSELNNVTTFDCTVRTTGVLPATTLIERTLDALHATS